MNVAARIRDHATRYPDRPALIEGRGHRSRVLSFADLDARTARGAAFLRDADHHPGDRVLFLQPVSIDLYVGLLSVLRAGMTAVFVDPGQSREFLESCVRSDPPEALFGGGRARVACLASPALRRISHRYSPRDLAKGSNQLLEEQENERLSDESAALITFTSGSTGRPKATARTRTFLGCQHRALEKAIQLEPGEVDLVTLPMFVLANLASGVTSVLADTDLARPGDVNARAICAQVAEFGVTRGAASPAFFESLLASGVAFPQFEKVFAGGAPVSPELLETLATRLPRAEISAVYGSSEAEPIAVVERKSISDDDAQAMRNGGGLLAGEPVPEIQCAVIRDGLRWDQRVLTEEEFSGLYCPPGEPGEIVVAGEHVLDGYLEDDGGDSRKIRVGDERWHRTGDAGYFDLTGRLWLLGRCEAAFAGAEGERCYPFQVENAANALPEVRRAAALVHCGAPVLIVELEKDARPSRELSAALFARVPQGTIARLRFVDHIPVDRRHNAKIDYVTLRSELRKQKEASLAD